MIKREELLEEIKKAGGTIEPIIKFCQFQNFGKSFLEFCIQPSDSPYRINLGSAGGPAVVCQGMPRLKSIKREVVEGKEVVVSEYEEIEPCPFRAEGKILGWRILLPAEG